MPVIYNNPDHIETVPAANGVPSMTFVVTPFRKNRPKGLRKPYDYILTLADTKALYTKLKALCKTIRPTAESYQYASARKKAVAYGIKLELFVLGHANEITKEKWETDCESVQALLVKFLGEDATIYAEAYRTTAKFQMRISTYIAYKEML